MKKDENQKFSEIRKQKSFANEFLLKDIILKNFERQL